MVHVRDLRLAGGEIFHDGSKVFARNFHEQFFNRFEQAAIGCFFPKHFGARNQNFITFAAHLLDENRNLHFAASADRENFRVACLRDAECHIGADFFHEPVPNVPRSHKFSILSGKRAIVHGEFHLDRRRINRDIRQHRTRFGITNRFADEHVLKTSEADDVARVRFLDLDALHALEMINRGDFVLRDLAAAVAANGGVADLHFSFDNFSERDTPDVIVVIQIRHENLKTISRLRARKRNVLHNRIKQRLHRAAGVFEFDFGVAFFRGAINERKIQLLIRRVERDEQFKNLVENFFRVRVLAVNLVDDHDRLRAGFERLAQHEARLRLRAFGGIHHEQHAVNHVHDALDLAAEIRVAGRVHDVDVVILVFERGVLGADGDALFLFQIHGIHQALFLRLVLVFAKSSRLLEQAIHERGLAVVNVRDDGDISNVLHRFQNSRTACHLGGKGQAAFKNLKRAGSALG